MNTKNTITSISLMTMILLMIYLSNLFRLNAESLSPTWGSEKESKVLSDNAFRKLHLLPVINNHQHQILFRLWKALSNEKHIVINLEMNKDHRRIDLIQYEYDKLQNNVKVTSHLTRNLDKREVDEFMAALAKSQFLWEKPQITTDLDVKTAILTIEASVNQKYLSARIYNINSSNSALIQLGDFVLSLADDNHNVTLSD